MNARICKIQSLLPNWEVDALLIESPTDLFYLTGLRLSRGRMWIEKGRVELHVDGRYIESVRASVECEVVLWRSNMQIVKQGRIGIDQTNTTIDGLEALRLEFPNVIWVGLKRPLRDLRKSKDNDELKALQEAARITWSGIEHIQSFLREGISEKEVAIEFECFIRREGSERLAFDSIVAFGKNSAFPHHVISDTRLAQNDIVLIDVGGVYGHYCADVTRTLFFGVPNPRLDELYLLVREADRRARKLAYPGRRAADLDLTVKSFFKDQGVADFFTHSLGHGVGLDVHEHPSINSDGNDRFTILEEGMVITIEPGLYIPGLGGIRHENTGVITVDGFVSFYPDA